MRDKLSFIRQELAQMQESKSYVNIRTMHSPADGWMVVDGKKVLNFCTNNYLGLANHPVLRRKAQEARVPQEGKQPKSEKPPKGGQLSFWEEDKS
jgi:glycine C-acetyltransferase